MRISQKVIFNAAEQRLGTLTEELYTANEVVTTGKRINRVSDDPVGMTRTLDLRSGLAHMDQLARNVSTGRTWLDAAETSMGNVESLLSDTKVLAIAMNNDAMNTTDRANAAVQVRETIMEIFDIANTQVNGQYLFAGTKTDIKPFAFDDPADPNLVSYGGNETGFSVKTGKDTSMVVGFPGEDVFGSTTVTIDETNNKIDFMENVGAGLSTELTADIPLGTYDKTSFAQAVEVAMETASATSGNAIQYDVSWDATTRQYTIAEDAAAAAPLTELQLLWNSGTNKATNAAGELGFDLAADTGAVTYTSDNTVQWGVFRTLFDLQDALENNDLDKIEKSLSKLDHHFNHMGNTISQIGYKGIALDVRETMIEDLGLSHQTQKAAIEEADIIEAITSLQSKELAYQAALASSSKVMKVSLLDYM